MTYKDRFEASKAYLPTDTKHLGEIQQSLIEDWTLPPDHLDRFLILLRHVSSLLQRPLEHLPANYVWLRAQLKPALADIDNHSNNTLARISEDLGTVLALSGVSTKRTRSRPPLNAAWKQLIEPLTKESRYKLKRLAHFCSSMRIEPIFLNNEVFAAYELSLSDALSLENPNKEAFKAKYYWNKAVDEVEGWPQFKIQRLDRRDRIHLSLSRFPQSFQDDVENLITQMRETVHLTSCWPRCPVSLVTVRAYRKYIQKIASGLVLEGFPLEEIISLKVIIEPSNMKRGLEITVRRNPGRSLYLFNLVTAIKAIARHYIKAKETEINELRKLCESLKPPDLFITPQTRKLLRQFDDESNILALFELPSRLLDEASRRDSIGLTSVNLVQWAVAIEILLTCPIKLGQLTTLNLDKNFISQGELFQDDTIMVVECSDYARRTVSFALSSETRNLILEYVNHYLPVNSGANTSWLFPGPDGMSHKAKNTLAMQIKGIIQEKTGLSIRVRLFRHLAAKLHLARHPGSYEVLRQLLGNRTLDATRKAFDYLELETAAKQFDEVVLKSGHI